MSSHYFLTLGFFEKSIYIFFKTFGTFCNPGAVNFVNNGNWKSPFNLTEPWSDVEFNKSQTANSLQKFNLYPIPLRCNNSIVPKFRFIKMTATSMLIDMKQLKKRACSLTSNKYVYITYFHFYKIFSQILANSAISRIHSLKPNEN